MSDDSLKLRSGTVTTLQMSDQPTDYLACGPVRIGATEVAEMDGPRCLVRVSRAEVTGLELAFAVGSDRPVLTVVMGIALVAVGLFPWMFLLLLFINGGHMRIALFWFTPFGLLGAWMIWFACKSRLVLLVRTTRDVRKAVFSVSIAPEDAERFAREAARRFGYPFSGLRDDAFGKVTLGEQPPTVLPIEVLDGAEVTRWLGLEDALAWVEHGDDVTSVVWQHDSIPFLQLGRLDMRLATGATMSLLSHIETGFYVVEALERGDTGSSPISRWRELRELPVGVLSSFTVRRDGRDVLELTFAVGSATIRLLAAEVQQEWDGTLRVCEPDESILVQLNGARPGP
jgi:hypothetical protein